MNRPFRCLCFAFLLVSCAEAVCAQVTLWVHVTDAKNKDVPGVRLRHSQTNSISPPTSDSGKTKLELPATIKPGTRIKVELYQAPKSLSLILPRNGQITVPNSPDPEDLTVCNKGDKIILHAPAAIAAITANIIESVIPLTTDIAVGSGNYKMELQKALKREAENLGLDPEELDHAIHDLGTKNEGRFARGVTALYLSNLTEALAAFSELLNDRIPTPKASFSLEDAIVFHIYTLSARARELNLDGKLVQSLKNTAQENLGNYNDRGDTKFAFNPYLRDEIGQKFLLFNDYGFVNTGARFNSLVQNSMLVAFRDFPVRSASPLWDRSAFIMSLEVNPSEFKFPDYSYKDRSAIRVPNYSYKDRSAIRVPNYSYEDRSAVPNSSTNRFKITDTFKATNALIRFFEARRMYAIAQKNVELEAATLSTLAALYERSSDLDNALRTYDRAIRVSEQLKGFADPDLVPLMMRFAALLRRTGYSAKAVAMESRAREISKSPVGLITR